MTGGIQIMNVITVYAVLDVIKCRQEKGQRNLICYQSDGEATVYQIIEMLPIQYLFTLLKNLHFGCICVAMVSYFSQFISCMFECQHFALMQIKVKCFISMSYSLTMCPCSGPLYEVLRRRLIRNGLSFFVCVCVKHTNDFPAQPFKLNCLMLFRSSFAIACFPSKYAMNVWYACMAFEFSCTL